MDHFKCLKDVINNISCQLQSVFTCAKILNAPKESCLYNQTTISYSQMKCSLRDTVLLTTLLTFTIRELRKTELSEDLLRNNMHGVGTIKASFKQFHCFGEMLEKTGLFLLSVLIASRL